MLTKFSKSKPEYRVSDIVSDFVLPTPFKLWFKYISSDPNLSRKIEVQDFAKVLHEAGAIEIFHYKKVGQLHCKILNEKLIQEIIRSDALFRISAQRRVNVCWLVSISVAIFYIGFSAVA